MTDKKEVSKKPITKLNYTKSTKIMKTYSAKPSEITREWYIIDASEAPLGRVATKVATMLTGKGKPIYTHHIDCGDNVIVINADKLLATGDKQDAKKYYHYSGYPSGLKTASLREKINKDSTEVIKLAVKGMLPKNKLMNDRLIRLKVYSGDEHNHNAQKPQKVSVK